MKTKNIKYILLILAALIFVLTLVIILTFKGKAKKEDSSTIKVGFVMPGYSTEEGWNRLHYDGIASACEELDIELVVKENVKEYSGQCEIAIRELAAEDVDIIILCSYGYADEVKDVVKEFPNITFYSESFDYYGDNLNCYFARIYQARYLSGIIAGYMSQTGVIGYVAAMPNSEVNRGINAFTLGVKRANPNAKVVVAWSDSWDDEEREMQLANELIEKENADVLAYHQNQPNVVQVAEDKDVYSIGYHEAYEGVSEKYLTTVEFRWDITYKELLSDYVRGKSDVVNTYWFGLEKDAIGLAKVSSLVPQEALTDVEAAKEEIVSGDKIFSGVIYDNQGQLRCQEDEIISDQVLMNSMDWYVEGIYIYEE